MSNFLIHTVVLHLLQITVYKKHQACLKEVEKDLQCFGVYPQVIRLAHWDEDMRKKFTQPIHDRYATELDIVYYGLSVHQ